MKFCPNCGTQLVETAKFCPSCGFKIAPVSASAVPPPTYQPQQNQSYSPPPTYQAPNPSSSYQQAYNQPNYGAQQAPSVGLVSRVKNILFATENEWLQIQQEPADIKKILIGYVLILALIPAISLLIGYGLIGQNMMGYMMKSFSAGISQAVMQLVSAVLTVYLVAFIVNMLAPGFSSQKDQGRALQLVAYGMTPMWVLGFLYLLPSFMILKILAMLLGAIYAVYLMYKGLPILMYTPSEKAFAYIVVVIIIGFIVMLVVTLILGLIMGLVMTGGAMGYGM
jgi:hypothetical protein